MAETRLGGAIKWGTSVYSLAKDSICTHLVIKLFLREKWDTNAMANRAMLHLLDYSFNMYAGMLYTLSITPVAHDAYG